MYFYIFIQPEIFEEAALDGEDAIQNVASILSGFLQNCFLSVFQDDRWDSSVSENLEKWPETMTRKRVKSLLAYLKKQRRFLYSIEPDYSEKKTDIDCVFEKAEQVSLDVILVISSEKDRKKPQGIEVTTRKTYQGTTFESKRTDIAVHGRTCKPGDMDETSFMEFHFKKALMHATTIEICDRVCGKVNFGDNFQYTIKKLIYWLKDILPDPKSCRLIFHFGQPKGKGADFIYEELRDLKTKISFETLLEVYFYDESQSLPNPTLPHQRFILTDQIALDIDRGLDFLEKKTKKCRDTYINYQKPTEARDLLKNYSGWCISKEQI